MSDNTTDPVYVPAYGVGVGFSAADEPDKVDCHLIMELPPPIGRLHVLLTPDQITTIHDVLHRAITMTDQQVREFVATIHTEKENNTDEQ